MPWACCEPGQWCYRSTYPTYFEFWTSPGSAHRDWWKSGTYVLNLGTICNYWFALWPHWKVIHFLLLKVKKMLEMKEFYSTFPFACRWSNYCSFFVLSVGKESSSGQMREAYRKRQKHVSVQDWAKLVHEGKTCCKQSMPWNGLWCPSTLPASLPPNSNASQFTISTPCCLQKGQDDSWGAETGDHL